MDTAPAWIVERVRERGPIPRGRFRVVVIESDPTVTSSCDYDLLEDARRHADDAASESDDPPPLAYVFDSDVRLVWRGRHYAAGGSE